jgi:hypothetical protein
MNIARALAPLLLVLAGGCSAPAAHEFSLAPTVEMDADFAASPYEAGQVAAALAAWEATGLVRFDVTSAPHAQVEADAAANPDRSVIFLVRQPFRDDPACPSYGEGAIPAGDTARTSWTSPGRAEAACFDASYMLAHDADVPGHSVYLSTLIHELGHALGLAHEPVAADGSAVAMYHANGAHQADRVAYDDARQLEAVWGLPSSSCDATADAGTPDAEPVFVEKVGR